MADVTGSSYLNRRPVPEGQMCDGCGCPATVRSAGERDSFGMEWNDFCDACQAKAEDAENARMHTCGDCHTAVRRDHGITWRWYDFYAAQGDEELFLCDPCWGAPKHKERVVRDRAAEKAEKAELDRGGWR